MDWQIQGRERGTMETEVNSIPFHIKLKLSLVTTFPGTRAGLQVVFIILSGHVWKVAVVGLSHLNSPAIADAFYSSILIIT